MKQPRKILHIDMDCFYAAIEVRDNPQLRNSPVAVGGSANTRGVLCTCNYEARKYGVRSAMATAIAMKLCPELILLPVNMPKYKEVSARIQKIFFKYSDLVEPLAFDEAFIDVTNCTMHNSSATLIAKEICREIWEQEQLTASAGVSCNKFLAKIASSWNKPNGIFVIRPDEVDVFIAKLSVKHLFGVGKVTANKMEQLNLHTCTDLQKLSLAELTRQFGKLGIRLYYQARGIDEREVNPHRVRKSLSVETTFAEDLSNHDIIQQHLLELIQRLEQRLIIAGVSLPIKSQFIKIKYATFKQSTVEISVNQLVSAKFIKMFNLRYQNQTIAIRLIGVGVRFVQHEKKTLQQELF